MAETTLIREWIEGEQIVLDNIPMRVEGGIGYQLSNVYGRKTQQGEPGPDDHPHNSTYTQRTWVGGLLVRDLQEAADVGKAWDGLAWTQTRGALGAPLKVVQIPLPEGAPSGAVTPLLRLGEHFYFAVGTLDGRLYEFVESSHTLRNPGGGDARSFTGTVMNTGVVFRVRDSETAVTECLYVPTTAGYTRLRSDFTVEHAPAPVAWSTVGFAIHEDKIWRLTSQGQVYQALFHDDEWSYVATIPDGSEVRNIYESWDDDGNRCIAVTTSSGHFLLDADNGIFFLTDLGDYPDHPYQGFGATKWRAAEYVSVGVGVHQRAGGLITARGLDADDGLPPELAGGFVVDLEPSYNILFAAVAGTLQGGELGPDEEMFGLTQGLPYPIVGKGEAGFGRLIGTNRIGAIYGWNGLGWSKFHQWERPPTRVVVSMVRNTTLSERHQHLFWGDVGGGCFTVHIPGEYYNPLLAPNLPLARTGHLTGSHIDWDMPDVPKVAKQLNVKPEHLYQEIPNGAEPVQAHNRIRLTLTWTDLDGIEHNSYDEDVINGPGPWPFCAADAEGIGVAPLPDLWLPPENARPGFAQNRRYSVPIGWARYKDGKTILPTGLPHEQIALNVAFEGDPDDPTELSGAVLEWYTLIARKWMRPQKIWTFQIDLSTAIKGQSEESVKAILDAICLQKNGVPLVTGDEFHIVDVTALDGNDAAGLVDDGVRTITCLHFQDETYEDAL